MTWFLDKAFLEKLDLRAYDAPAIAQRLGMDVATVAQFVDPARRYLVQTSEAYGWLAGASGDLVGREAVEAALVEDLAGGGEDRLDDVGAGAGGRRLAGRDPAVARHGAMVPRPAARRDRRRAAPAARGAWYQSSCALL